MMGTEDGGRNILILLSIARTAEKKSDGRIEQKMKEEMANTIDDEELLLRAQFARKRIEEDMSSTFSLD